MGAPVRLAIAAGPLAIAAIVATTAPAAHAATEGRMVPGMYTTGTRTAPQPLPLVQSAIDVDVDGPFAEATITQRFRNPFDHAIEAVYTFPLPDDAAVSSMVIRTGDRTIVARVEDRAAARARYEAAVAAGVAGALLEQERPDVFTQAVTAIPPRGEIAVELRWDMGVARRAGAWELVLPLVIGPRYVPGAATGAPTRGTGWSADTDRAPDASRVTPDAGDGVGTVVHVRIRATGAIEAVEVPSHDAEVRSHGASADVTLTDKRSDRDAVIRWKTRGDALAARTDADGFVAVVVPAPATARAAPHDWIVVVDTSKSLAGDGIVLVRRAARALLDHVGARDRVALVGAGGARLVALGGATAVRQARTWIDAAAPDGTADLVSGLVAARALARGDRQAAIVLISDGLVANDGEVLAAAAAGPPIFSIGIGAAPNHALLDGLAQRSGGAARYTGAADDADATIGALVAQVDAPRAIAIAWGGLVTDPMPATLPALAPGDAAVVIAKVDRPGRARVAVAARAIDLPATWVQAPARPDAIAPASVIARRWARAKVAALVADGGHADDVRALGLRYGLVTPETALVAIGDRAVVDGGVNTSVAVPVALPAGMRWQAVFGAGGDQSDAIKATGPAKESPADKREHERGTVTIQGEPSGATTTGGATGATDATGAARRGEAGEGAKAPTPTSERTATAPPPAAESEDLAEEVVLSGYAESRPWRLGLTLGAGALVAPDAHAIGVASIRVDHRLGDTGAYRAGLDLTLLAAPAAHDDRVAVALMGALLRGGLLQGRLAFELGVGPELASDPGLGYAIAARFGRGVGLVLRWDGAVLFGGDGASHRGSATAGVSLDF